MNIFLKVSIIKSVLSVWAPTVLEFSHFLVEEKNKHKDFACCTYTPCVGSCTSVDPFIIPSVCLSVSYLPACLVSACLSPYLWLFLLVCSHICLPACLSVCLCVSAYCLLFLLNPFHVSVFKLQYVCYPECTMSISGFMTFCLSIFFAGFTNSPAISFIAFLFCTTYAPLMPNIDVIRNFAIRNFVIRNFVTKKLCN
jgi:hypothetical protein